MHDVFEIDSLLLLVGQSVREGRMDDVLGGVITAASGWMRYDDRRGFAPLTNAAWGGAGDRVLVRSFLARKGMRPRKDWDRTLHSACGPS